MKKTCIMYNDKWLNDLEQGEIGERVIADFFIERGWIILEWNKTIEYDIRMRNGDKEIKLEIKTDRWEFFNNKITNNIFLEVKCGNKKSGIMATTADFFIYYFPDLEVFYMIKVYKARELVNYGVRKAFSGDGGRVIGYTINKNDWSDWFKIEKIDYERFRKKSEKKL